MPSQREIHEGEDQAFSESEVTKVPIVAKASILEVSGKVGFETRSQVKISVFVLDSVIWPTERFSSSLRAF